MSNSAYDVTESGAHADPTWGRFCSSNLTELSEPISARLQEEGLTERLRDKKQAKHAPQWGFNTYSLCESAKFSCNSRPCPS